MLFKYEIYRTCFIYFQKRNECVGLHIFFSHEKHETALLKLAFCLYILLLNIIIFLDHDLNLLAANEFTLLIDGCEAITNITSFKSGITMLYMAYYVFNIVYNGATQCTMEFIQR